MGKDYFLVTFDIKLIANFATFTTATFSLFSNKAKKQYENCSSMTQMSSKIGARLILQSKAFNFATTLLLPDCTTFLL